MKRKLNTLNEEVSRIKSLFDFDFNYDDLLIEAEESTSTFEFSDSYPDNIAFPLIPNSNAVHYNQALNSKNISPDLLSFIKRLKSKISGGVKIEKIKINSGASSDKPTTTPPDGYTKEMVQYSFRDPNGVKETVVGGKKIKISLDNKILAKNRGKYMGWILEHFIPSLKNVNIEYNPNLNKKVVSVILPSKVMVNMSTHPEISKEYIKPKKIYKPSFDKPSVIATCNKESKSTGSGGMGPKYIADRIKLELPKNYSGNIKFKYNSYAIPDRFKLISVKNGKETKIKDTGFISSSDGEMFTILQNELKTFFPDSKLNKGGGGEISFKTEPDTAYYIDVIAPFGGTYWSASLGCGESEKTEKFNPNGYNKTYNKNGDISMEGDFKNDKLFKGRKFVYDEDNLLHHIEIWENGKYTGRNGTI